MKFIALVVLFAVVGTILADDMKEDEKAKKVVDRKKVLRAQHLTTEEKNRLIKQKKEFRKDHADMTDHPESDRVTGQSRREFMRTTKEKMMEIKKSDLPKEEKKAKLINLKKELTEAKTNARNGRRGQRMSRLSPEERRALIERKKSAAAAKGATYGQKRNEKKAVAKLPGAKTLPLIEKRGDMKKFGKY